MVLEAKHQTSFMSLTCSDCGYFSWLKSFSAVLVTTSETPSELTEQLQNENYLLVGYLDALEDEVSVVAQRRLEGQIAIVLILLCVLCDLGTGGREK